MISGSNEQLQQELEYTLLKPDSHSWWISKIQSGCEEERYAIKFCFKLRKNAMRWKQGKHAGFPRPKKARRGKSTHKLLLIPFFDSNGMIYMPWVTTGQTVNKEYYVEVLREFRKRFRQKRPALFKSAQWHFHQDNAPVHNSILVTDYLTKMGIKTVPRRPYSSDLAPCDFCLFPKLTGCRYETMRWKRLTKVIDTLTQADFHGSFQKLLEQYNKCIAAEGDYFEGDLSFMLCTINKSAQTKKVWKLI